MWDGIDTGFIVTCISNSESKIIAKQTNKGRGRILKGKIKLENLNKN